MFLYYQLYNLFFRVLFIVKFEDEVLLIYIDIAFYLLEHKYHVQNYCNV